MGIGWIGNGTSSIAPQRLWGSPWLNRVPASASVAPDRVLPASARARGSAGPRALNIGPAFVRRAPRATEPRHDAFASNREARVDDRGDRDRINRVDLPREAGVGPFGRIAAAGGPEDLGVDVDAMDQQRASAWRRRTAFLREFARTGVVAAAVRAAGVGPDVVKHWRKDPAFRELYDEAREEAADALEQEARRRALDGYDEPVLYRGLPTIARDPATGEERLLTVRRYSDQLLAILLKAARPEKFRENHSVEVEARGGVLVVPAAIDPESWARTAAAQQAESARNAGQPSSSPHNSQTPR